MEYTAMPLSYIGGTYFGAAVCAILLLYVLWGIFFWDWSYKYDKSIKIFMIFLATMLFTLIGYVSYDTYVDHKNLTNTQVVGRMVGNESALERVSSGKGQTRLVSALYVFYELPEGIVSFRRASGIVYPEVGVFYANPK